MSPIESNSIPQPWPEPPSLLHYKHFFNENERKIVLKEIKMVVDILSQRNFGQLIEENFDLGLDYVLAVVNDDEGNFIPFDGCLFANLMREYKGTFCPITALPIREILYYSLQDIDGGEFQLLDPGEKFVSEVISPEGCYLMANNSMIEAKDRAMWGYRYGNFLYERKEYNEALTCFLKAAEAGNAAGKLMVATCAAEGQGIEADLAKAKEWYLAAAYDDLSEAAVGIKAANRLGELGETELMIDIYLALTATGNPGAIAHYIAQLETSGDPRNHLIAQEWRKQLPTEYQNLKIPALLETTNHLLYP